MNEFIVSSTLSSKVHSQIQSEDHLQRHPLVQIRTLLAAKSQDGDDLNLLNFKWVTEVEHLPLSRFPQYYCVKVANANNCSLCVCLSDWHTQVNITGVLCAALSTPLLLHCYPTPQEQLFGKF